MTTNSNTVLHEVIIIGSGPAGCTAAIYAARANLSPIVITGPLMGGQLTQTPDIQNWPGIESTSGYELMEKQINHAKSLGVKFITDTITNFTTNKIENSKNTFTLTGESTTYNTKTIIVATGASPKSLGLSSEEKFKTSGLSFCATCDGFFYRKQEVAVIGGGNTAISDAIYLANICSKVHLVHRRDTFRAEVISMNKIYELVKEGKIELHINCIVDEFLGNDLQGLQKIKLTNKLTNETSEITVSGAFIAIGHKPNTDCFKELQHHEDGTICVGLHEGDTSTSIEGIFAAGDCADHVYRQAITSAGTGCKAAQDVIAYLQK